MRSQRFALSLRWSLLASLGLLPAACGGTTENHTGGASKPSCTAPQPLTTSGIVSCSEGYTYRSKAAACSSAAASGRDPHTLPRVTDFVDCTNDESVCDAYQFGFCGSSQVPDLRRGCVSGCGADADCGPGGMCRCDGDSVGHCSFDSCASDADCEAGYHCASYSEGCGNSRYSCQTAQDDCSACQGSAAEKCLLQADGHRECGAGSVCGRPFLVGAEARLPPLAWRSDWARDNGTAPRLDHLTARERHALSEHWTRMALMEHASIAAFARFSLQLLALGAPPELVESCTRALADETAHAKLCFQLASAYAGRAIGPGPLEVSRSLDVTSLADIVDLVIAEGCFGETSAALEAREGAELATDPVIREAYTRIAGDEQRHAELAFQFVRWALTQQPEAAAARIAASLRASAARTLSGHAVVVPCLEALLARSARAA